MTSHALQPRWAGRLHVASPSRLPRAVVAAGVSAGAAALLVLALPRGPLTSSSALATLALGLAAGALTGYVLRSRWALAVAPLALVAAYEIRWAWVDGPTVDAPRLDSAYGVLALLLGRGFLGLVCIPPMLVGAAWGAALARRRSGVAHRPSSRRARAALVARRIVAGATALGVVALAVQLARPATTPRITGPDGSPVPGSIAALEQVELGGGRQWIQLRGHSVDSPVLLYLHGGPGQSGLPFTRLLLGELERDFVVVDWDQRGTGKSHGALEPTATYTLDAIVDDTIELAHLLADRFGERRIYLAGSSWGTTLGVLAVQRDPSAFHAFVGGGQMVSQRETDVRIYRGLVAHATRAGDEDMLAHLRSIGEPPYDDVFANAWVMQQYEALEPEYTLVPAVERIGEEHGGELGPWGVLGREYDLVEKVNVLRGLMETFAVVYPQLQELDFRRDVRSLDVPVYLFRGTSELAARDDLAVEWFDTLEAPRKRMFELDHAGHAVLQERADRLREVLRDIVLPETYETRGAER